MTALDDVAKTKLLQMKALLGDEASKKILDAAAAKEAQAQTAGLEFKETKLKDDTETAVDETEGTEDQLTLSQLLAELEDGLASGAIVDDVTTTDEADGASAEELKEADAAFRTALKEVVTEVFDEKFAGFLTALSLKEASANPAVAQMQTQMKETETRLAKQKEQLDVLLGIQPKAKPFRASQSEDTVVTAKDATLDGPHADPVGSFINDFVLGAGANGKA